MDDRDQTVRLIVGRPKCGKSEWVERELSSWPQRVYVGTLLTRSDEHRSIIEIHKARRGDGWTLIELSGQTHIDMESIHQCLGEGSHSVACMIDGLTSWAICWSELGTDLLGAAFSVGSCIADLVLTYPNVTWRFLDVPPESFSEQGFMVHAAACKLIQDMVSTHVSSIHVVAYPLTSIIGVGS